MSGRWTILAVLFAVRATMGFQFQSVPAVAPLIGRDFGVGLADIGFLIGLYLAPGMAVAFPGGAIGRRFGDKAVVLAALVLMMAGSLLMALVPTWPAQLAGRLVAGIGGVLLNVLMSKMVTDWFAGHEIATAMGVFVNSWPVGVALGLVALPPIGAAHGTMVVFLATSAAVALGFVLLAAFYTPPPVATTAASASERPNARAIAAVLVAGAIWSFYNIGFAMIFGFGPSLLVEQGWTLIEAGSAVSIVLWLAIVSVPLGGVLADRSQHQGRLTALALVVFATSLAIAARGDAAIPMFVVLGLVCGLPAGSIMSLPMRVLPPATRAVGMGLFFTIYYAGMFAAPTIAGRFAAAAGSAVVAFDFGAVLLLAAALLTWVFQWLAAASLRSATT